MTYIAVAPGLPDILAPGLQVVFCGLNPGVDAAAAGLQHKLALMQPQWIAFLGKAAYAAMTGKRQLAWGEQPERFGGARVWILPNPSGLNRGYSKERLVDAYAELRRALG